MFNIGSIGVKLNVDKSDLTNLPSEVESSAQSLGSTLAKIGAKLATAFSVKQLWSEAMSAYSTFEQVTGGVEKLFGNSASKIESYANTAASRLQLSANEYMEYATKYGATLVNQLGGDTAKAAEQVDKAITIMRDNASIMGTDISQLETAFSGFARGSFIALDNLRLGYSGTATGMEQLLKDAEALSGIEYDISSYSDIIDAIQVIQENMNIAGNAAKEAGSTIEGLINSIKAKFENLSSTMFQTFAPALKTILQLANSLLDKTSAITGLLGGAAVGGTVYAIASLIPGLREVALVAGVASAAVAALITGQSAASAAAYKNMENVAAENIANITSGLTAAKAALADFNNEDAKLERDNSVAAMLENYSNLTTKATTVAWAINGIKEAQEEYNLQEDVAIAASDTYLELLSDKNTLLRQQKYYTSQIAKMEEEQNATGLTAKQQETLANYKLVLHGVEEELSLLEPELANAKQSFDEAQSGMENAAASAAECRNNLSDMGGVFAGLTNETLPEFISLMDGVYGANQNLVESLGFVREGNKVNLKEQTEANEKNIKEAKTYEENLESVKDRILELGKANDWEADKTEKLITTLAGKSGDELEAYNNASDRVFKEFMDSTYDLDVAMAELSENINSTFESTLGAMVTAAASSGASAGSAFFAAFEAEINVGKFNFKRTSPSQFTPGSPNGIKSSRTGDLYVPYDGYLSILHQGERVLTASEASRYNKSETKGSITNNFNITVPNDGNALSTAIKLRDLTRKEAYNLG